VRVCEEIRELAVPLAHGAYYEVRPPGLDGGAEISLRDLVKFLLAMRPDRIVVGEVRGAEAFELTRAINAGCGFLCTVHANRARDAMRALVNAALMAGRNVTEPVVHRVFADAIDVVVHVDREQRTGRRVVEIAALSGDRCESVFVASTIERPLVWTGEIPVALEERIDRVLADHEPVRVLIERGAIPA
jgi:pilus assembly protein CpaF